MNDEASHLPARWLAAVADPAVAGALESVYAAAAEAVAARGPACWASGRCCNFEKTGHRLYVTGLEAAYTVARLDGRDGPRAAAGSPAVGHSLSLPVLTAGSVAAARSSGGCPFQSGNLCSVHAIKPLGCRVYFCDRGAQDWQHEVSERLLARIRAIHETHAIEYRYGEWRAMLGMFT